MMALGDLRRTITAAKEKFLNDKIAEFSGKRSLFNIVYSFVQKKPGLWLPAHDDLPTMLERFVDFFIETYRRSYKVLIHRNFLALLRGPLQLVFLMLSIRSLHFS